MLAVLAVASFMLSGCAIPRLIDSDVQSFPTADAPAAGSRYRFDRLPSHNGNANQDQMEAWAERSLGKVGLVRDAAQAAYTVQVQWSISQIPNPQWPQLHGPTLLRWREQDPDSSRWGLFRMRAPDPPWTRHSVQLVIRQTASAQVVYETRAAFDGPWYDSDNLMPIVLDAALAGYPQPPAGLRKVVIELGYLGTHGDAAP